jgi:hypothetical protein
MLLGRRELHDAEIVVVETHVLALPVVLEHQLAATHHDQGVDVGGRPRFQERLEVAELRHRDRRRPASPPSSHHPGRRARRMSGQVRRALPAP